MYPWHRKHKKKIVRNGLVLYLDGKDFLNNPPTSLWMDRAKPNQVTYSNLITNGNFSNGITGWVIRGNYINSVSTTSNAIPCLNVIGLGLGDGSSNDVYYPLSGLTIGHKYYCSSQVKNNGGALVNVIMLAAGFSSSKVLTDLWTPISIIFTSTSTGHGLMFYGNNISNFLLSNVMCIDLTALFGAGNEPSQAECDSLFTFTPTTNTVMRGNNGTPSNFNYSSSSGSDGLGEVVFDGTDDFVTVNSSPSLINFTNEATIIVKGKFKAGMIVAKGYSLNLRATPTLSCIISTDTGSTTTSNFTPSSNVTYVVTFVYKNKQGHIYVNGVEQTYSSQPIDTLGTIKNDNTEPLYIAKRKDTQVYGQTINNILIYNRGLSNQEILRNYNALR